ncbi:unnamed protein product [Closterium sp. NIES-54]
MVKGSAHSVRKGGDALPSTHHPVITSLTSLSQLKPKNELFFAARFFLVALGLLLVTYHFFESSATRHSPIEWFDMHSFDAKLAASDANTSGRVYPQRFVAISLPAESPPSVTLPAESPPPVSLPAESPPAVFLPAESAPAVPLPAESPPSVSLPAESPPPLSLPTEPSVSLPAESPPAVSLPAESAPAVSLPDESAPAVSLPAESASAVSFPAESAPAVSLPAESPPVSLPAESAPAVSLPAESPPAVSLPAVSLPTESPPAVSLPADSPPAVSLPAESPLAVSLPAESPPPVPTESPPSVSLPAESPHVDRPPPDGNGPLVAFHRAFASLVSFQRKGRVPFANVATFNFDPSVTSSAFAATHFKLLSLPVPPVPEKLTWRDAYPTWVNESRASCSKFPEPSYPDWLTSIHAIVAHVPCDEPSDSWAKDVRWLHHLLTITNFVIRVLFTVPHMSSSGATLLVSSIPP